MNETQNNSPKVARDINESTQEDVIEKDITTSNNNHSLTIRTPMVENTNPSIKTDRNELPTWMMEYFEWHNRTKSALNEDNWNSTKYIVMKCGKNHQSCGGISDRLKPLPFAVLEAYRYKRLLLIWWEKPKPLEDFLLPPEGGVDWRVPQWLKAKLKTVHSRTAHGHETADRDLQLHPNLLVQTIKIQTPTAGEDFYEQQPDSKSTYQDVFHHLFRRFFTPVPRLAATIQSKMKEHDLIPGEYAATHLRAMYGNRKWRDPNETIALTVNGINCASTLFPGAPVYFAADIKFASEVASEYGRQRSLPVGSLEFVDNPIHFDKDPEWYKRDASVYDDTFVDLFMLGESRCVAYSNGGYGTFGSLLSYNSNCSMRYFKGRKVNFRTCKWTTPEGSKRLRPPEVHVPPELWIQPE